MAGQLVVGTEALASGRLTCRDLKRGYTKLYRNVYAPNGVALDATDRAVAAWLWSGRSAIVAGSSAAALLGARWIPPSEPASLVRPLRRAAPPGIVVHTDTLADDEICGVDGIRCTTPARTAYDIARREPLETAVIRIDALLQATDLEVDEVAAIGERYPGARGIRPLRSALALVDAGAESPQETKTRLLLVRAGLPAPQTQIEVRNKWGWVDARIDMGWPEWLVGVEYDGEHHWTNPDQYSRDIERLELLASQGWIIVRVSARQLRHHPGGVVERVRNALLEAGFRG
jgi:REase_MTES_1575